MTKKHRPHYGLDNPPQPPDPQNKGKRKKFNPYLAKLLEEQETIETEIFLRDNPDQSISIGRGRTQICNECHEPFQQDKGGMARKTQFSPPEFYCNNCIEGLDMIREVPKAYPYKKIKKGDRWTYETLKRRIEVSKKYGGS